MAHEPGIIEWYRADESRRLVRVVGVGSVLVAAGVFLLGVALSRTAMEPAWRVVMGALGGACTLAGPAQTLWGIHRSLARDVYLALRRDGVTFHDGQTAWSVPWDDLVAVRWQEAPPALLLERRNTEPVRVGVVFYGVVGKDLARHVEHVRRRALMNLLR